ncbi:MAG: hypothetical protein HND58_07820 [Planctomycetota bacterium]|nr:MAG: hypothetical protein HND58_07820 [Planctomycetota bacterium]
MWPRRRLIPAAWARWCVTWPSRLREEPDASVADAIARSLLVAANTRREGFVGSAARATSALGAGVGERLRAADDNDRQVALMTAVRVAESYSNAMAAAGQVTPEAARAGAGFAGQVLGHMASRASKGEMPATEGWEADLVTFCERIMVFSASKLGGSVAAPGAAGACRERRLPGVLRPGQQAGARPQRQAVEPARRRHEADQRRPAGQLALPGARGSQAAGPGRL